MELLELLGHVEDLRGPPVVSIGPIAMLGQELPMGLVGRWGSRSPWSSLARPASSLSSLGGGEGDDGGDEGDGLPPLEGDPRGTGL